MDSCEFYIEPGAPGEPLSLEAHYDAHDYRLEETVEEGVPRSYRLRFLVDSSRLITGIKQGLRGGQPQLTLVQRNGGAIVDLSLSLVDAIVRLPRGARVTGLDGDLFTPRLDEEVHTPTLNFTVESGARTTLRVFE